MNGQRRSKLPAPRRGSSSGGCRSHPEYKKLVRGSYADLNNAPERGKAGSITAAEFLAAFAGDTPWVHLDIAGTAWNLGRAYAEKGGRGFGVRLLVELASANR